MSNSNIKIFPFIQVLSEADLLEVIELGEPHYSHCITIADPGEGIEVSGHFAAVLALEFDDINKKTDKPPESHPRVPSMADVKKIIRFYQATKTEATGYTINCYAGVHRSTAVALMILYMMTGSEEEAARLLNTTKALPLPNRKLVQLFDKRMKTNLAEATEVMWQNLDRFLSNELFIDGDDYLVELPVIEEEEA